MLRYKKFKILHPKKMRFMVALVSSPPLFSERAAIFPPLSNKAVPANKFTALNYPEMAAEVAVRARTR
jgi:hypothetical protein